MSENKAAHFPVKWLITIVDRGRGEIAAELLNQIHKSFHMISLGQWHRQFRNHGLSGLG